MTRKLIIDGNAVYELDENCKLQKEVTRDDEKKQMKNRRQSDTNHKRE